MSNLLQRLKDAVLDHEIDSLYDIWGGSLSDSEYDFTARQYLSVTFPETSWENPEHENMLLEMALDSHARKWKPDYLNTSWTKERYYLDELSNLFKYYNVWQKITNNCGGNNDRQL
jgi:hypothetical protein